MPILPVINNRTAPSYKLAKHLTKILNQFTTLNNHYNIINSTSFALDLSKNVSSDDEHDMLETSREL